MNNLKRIIKLAKKLDLNTRLMAIAKRDLGLANKHNPFITKSMAMTEINRLRKENRMLGKIWNLEWSL